MNRTARLTTLHQFAATAGGTAVITDEGTIADLLAMPPLGEAVRRDDRWAQMRSLRMETGDIFAVVSSGGDGLLHVTAHSDVAGAHAAWSRVCQEVLGRPRGVLVRHLPASALIGRTVANEHGAEFQVGGLYLDTQVGRVVIDLLDLDDDGEPVPGTECGVVSLDGWQVY
jgi:hypothetical protein